MISEELLQSFIAEASDLLDDIEPSLIDYSHLDSVEERAEVVNRVFRHFHSIKGSAGFVGLHDIARLTHEAEALLEQFRRSPERVISQDTIALLCATVDLLRAIFASGGENVDREGNDLEIESRIKEIVGATREIKEILRPRSSAGSQSPGDGDGSDPKRARSLDLQQAVDLLSDAVRGSEEAVEASHPEPAKEKTGGTKAREGEGKRGSRTLPSPRPDTPRSGRPAGDTARIINIKQLARQEKMSTGEFTTRYVSEANELLEQIEQSLLQAEQHPEAGNEAIQEALRCLHSFKGNSGFMNLSDLERLGHRMESEIECNVGRSLGLDSQTFDVLLQMIDVLRQGVLDFSCGGSGSIPEADAYIAMMDEFSTRPHTIIRPLEDPSGSKPPGEEKAVPPSPGNGDPDVSLGKAPVPPPGAASDAESAADKAKTSIHKETATRRILRSDTEHTTKEAVAGGQADDEHTTRMVLRGTSSTQEDLRKLPKTENIVISNAPPEAGTARRATRATEKQNKSTQRMRSLPAKAGDTGQKRRAAEQLAARNDIRVDLRKLDGMLDLVGELVIAEAMVTRHPIVWNAENESLERAVHQLRRVASSLQDMATSVRMIPLAPTFRRMTRLVYDLSVKAGKQVDLILLGEDTEVDRTVIERISDPLVHIIRNAIDHGIESPEERIEAGKPETGRLTIEGHHEGGEVWIVITDDGRGLNRNAILQRAISRGLIQGDGSDLGDNQIYHFIFEPGFSTATKVTDISGRGFGMDVVKKNIEKLSGRIDIRTRQGEGTAVVMRIPLTLAIIDGMLVSSGGTRYIIPLLSIRESLRPEAGQILSTPDGQQMVKLREDLIPIVRLDETFSRLDNRRDLLDGILMIVEGEDGEVVALFADELLGQQETVIKGLSGWLKKSRGVSGCTILGDGEVGLILDIGAIVRLARERSTAE